MIQPMELNAGSLVDCQKLGCVWPAAESGFPGPQPTWPSVGASRHMLLPECGSMLLPGPAPTAVATGHIDMGPEEPLNLDPPQGPE